MTVKEAMMNNIRVSDERIRQQQCDDKINNSCQFDTDTGERIRGYVTAVKCAGCGHDRWDDGTPCKHVNSRGQKRCGRMVRADENTMEDGRIG